jgi:two-component system OmpR family response regulator/two-component system response regulator QseB
MRVLVIENDHSLTRGFSVPLLQAGWTLSAAPGSAEAWDVLNREPFDIVLLDVDMPNDDGQKLLRQLRSPRDTRLPDPMTPVLAFSEPDQIAARIRTLDMGADDCMVRPFDPGELAARMRALHRRCIARALPKRAWGKFEIDPETRSVHKGGQMIDLSVREFGILAALFEASPRVLSRHEIETQLGSLNERLESNAIEVHIHHLRKKLGRGVIRTIRGLGYCMPSDFAKTL